MSLEHVRSKAILHGRGRAWLAAAALAAILSSASAVGLLATSAWLIVRAAEHPPVLNLMVAIVAVRALALTRAVLRYAERLISHDAAFRALGTVRERSYQQLERLAPSGLDAFRSGDLLSRLVGDVDAEVDRVVRVLLPLSTAVCVAGAAALGAWILLPSVGLILLGAGAVLLGGVPLLVRTAGRRAARLRAPMRGLLLAGIHDLLLAAPDLIAFGAADRALAELAVRDADLQRVERRSAWSNGIGHAVLLVVIGGAVAATLAVAVPAARLGVISPVVLAVLVLLPLGLADVLAPVSVAADELDRTQGALRRVRAIFDAPAPVAEPLHPEDLPFGPYGLDVDGLVVHRAGGARAVLDGLHISLRPGERTAIVGASGSGKSTMAMTLLRELEPTAGTLQLSGVDMRQLSGDAVRRVIGLCAQDAYIFDSDIRENVRLAAPEATESQIQDALTRAGLEAWVQSLRRGLDTRVGQNGLRISGGERQRIALARILLADFPIVLLDEPTEHLDDATAARVMRDLLDVTTGRTLLILTHDRRILSEVDQSFELANGRLRRIQDRQAPVGPSDAPGGDRSRSALTPSRDAARPATFQAATASVSSVDTADSNAFT